MDKNIFVIARNKLAQLIMSASVMIATFITSYNTGGGRTAFRGMVNDMFAYLTQNMGGLTNVYTHMIIDVLKSPGLKIFLREFFVASKAAVEIIKNDPELAAAIKEVRGLCAETKESIGDSLVQTGYKPFLGAASKDEAYAVQHDAIAAAKLYISSADNCKRLNEKVAADIAKAKKLEEYKEILREMNNEVAKLEVKTVGTIADVIGSYQSRLKPYDGVYEGSE